MQLKYIDSLRGIAILGVIIVHTSQWGASIYTHGVLLYPSFINRLFEQGARGVQLFYVVSAFTLFLSYYTRKQGNKYNIWDYAIRRVFRVVPLYWIGILFFGVLTPLILNSNIQLSPVSLISNLSLLNSLWPAEVIVPGGWTISVEILFYALLPLLYKYIKNTNHAVFFTLVATIISIFYNFTFFHFFEKTRELEYFIFTSFPNQLPLFGFGIIAFFTFYKKDYKVDPLLIFTISVMLVLQLTLIRFIPNHIMFGFPFLLLVISGGSIYLLKSDVLAFLGKISFSAYFVHFAVLYWINYHDIVDFYQTDTQIDALVNFSIRLALTSLLVIAISIPIHYFIEIPFQKLGKKLILKLSNE